MVPKEHKDPEGGLEVTTEGPQGIGWMKEVDEKSTRVG